MPSAHTAMDFITKINSMGLLDAASLNNRPFVVPVVCFIVLRSTVPEEQNKHTQHVPPISDSNKKRAILFETISS